VVDDIRSATWRKLVVNASELVPSAILKLPLADAVAVPGMREFMVQAGKEAVRTAVALGNTIVPIFGMRDVDTSDPDRFAEDLLNHVLSDYTLPNTRTTVLQDWDKGRRAEVDELNGIIVAAQDTVGRPAPANAITVELARRIESGDLDAKPENAELLLAVLADAH
jgi:2-dehydropantoate 2-reductase